MIPNDKKVMAIHDISGFGRASLTTVIPVLSTMGIQVCPIPTALLSTHSGVFEGYTFYDLTDNMEPYAAHWKELGLEFDCIYTGFLGSPHQVDIVMDIIEDFRKPDNIVLVDPVLGDEGKLYDSISPEMLVEMKKLVSVADIIVPNATEAAFLIGEEPAWTMSRSEIKRRLRSLSDMGPSTAIITSVEEEDRPNEISAIAYERATGKFWKVLTNKLPGEYPGTGDLFASVFVGALLQGDSLPVSMERAVKFVGRCIQISRGFDYPQHYGVLLERELHLLREANFYYEFEEI